MSLKKIIAAFVLVDFLALNAYAVYSAGLGELVAAVTEANIFGHVLHADLVIALGMLLYWVWTNARENGRNPWGYTLATLGLGSVGPLLYVVLGSSENEGEVGDAVTEGNEKEMDLGGSGVSAGAG